MLQVSSPFEWYPINWTEGVWIFATSSIYNSTLSFFTWPVDFIWNGLWFIPAAFLEMFTWLLWIPYEWCLWAFTWPIYFLMSPLNFFFGTWAWLLYTVCLWAVITVLILVFFFPEVLGIEPIIPPIE